MNVMYKKRKFSISDFANVPLNIRERCQSFDASYANDPKIESKIAMLDSLLNDLKEVMPNCFAESIFQKLFLSGITKDYSTLTAVECFSAIDKLGNDIEMLMQLVEDITSQGFSLELSDPNDPSIVIQNINQPHTAIHIATEFKALYELAYWFTTLKEQATNFLKPYAQEQNYFQELASKMMVEQKTVMHIKGDSCFIPVEKSISIRKVSHDRFNVEIGKVIAELLNQVLKK